MLNIGSGELVFIAVVALLVLGPKRLPELARGIGKFVREFRRQTDEVRHVVQREFYKMDQEASFHDAPVKPRAAREILPEGGGLAGSVSPSDSAGGEQAVVAPDRHDAEDVPTPPVPDADSKKA